jgi:hypothetical protein
VVFALWRALSGICACDFPVLGNYRTYTEIFECFFDTTVLVDTLNTGILNHNLDSVRQIQHSKALKQTARSLVCNLTVCYRFNHLTQSIICGLILPIAVLIGFVFLLIATPF